MSELKRVLDQLYQATDHITGCVWPTSLTLLSCTLLSCLWFAAGCRAPLVEEVYSQLHSPSGIRGKPYQQIVADMRALESSTSGKLTVTEYGRSVRDKPLVAIRLMDPNGRAQGQRPAILISEGIHGDEYTNIADRLVTEFLNAPEDSTSQRFLKAGGLIYIVPIVNPDGYDASQRENANRQDLNRDFVIRAARNTGFTQPETRTLTNYIAAEAREHNFILGASMEYHCCIGGLIHPWAYKQDPMEPTALQRHRKIGALVREVFGYRYGTVREIVGYDAVGGSDDYYLETYRRRAFSFEGRQGTENQNLPQHVRMWNGIMGEVLADASGGDGDQSTASSIYFALGNDMSGYVGLPSGWQQAEICYGRDCSGQKVAATRRSTIAGRTIFQTQEAIRTSGSEFEITIRAQRSDATSPVFRRIRLRRR